MPTLSSEILIVGHPQPHTVALGAQFSSDFAEAENHLRNSSLNDNGFKLVAFCPQPATIPRYLEFLAALQQRGTDGPMVILVTGEDFSGQLCLELCNSLRVIAIVKQFLSPEFGIQLQRAWERIRHLAQEDELIGLFEQQNQNLQRLSRELEERVEKRQSFLAAAKERLETSAERFAALHRAVMAVQRASCLAEMERLLLEALAQPLSLSWIRIQLKTPNSSNLLLEEAQRLYSIYKSSLQSGNAQVGQVFFARDSSRAFRRDEKSFLAQLTEAIALAANRIAYLEMYEVLRGQWQATFDAINHPLCVIDENYQINRVNRAYIQKAQLSADQLVARKCFKALFSLDQPCPGCQLGLSFRMTGVLAAADRQPELGGGQGEPIYRVDTQQILFKSAVQTKLYVAMYRDVTEEEHLQAQIIESAKLAELGTVGSSIAHEINNPLGGMLSYLQLMKMDLRGNEAFFADIEEMEAGVKRCRDIVSNLLSFSRESRSEDINKMNFIEVVKQALKIAQLQTQSRGIGIQAELPAEPIWLNGHFNQLAQAICSILQNFTANSPAPTSSQTGGPSAPSHPPSMKLAVFESPGFVSLEITRLSGAESYEPGAGVAEQGLSLAKQILSDHGGALEFSRDPRQRTLARLTLPK